MHATAPTLICKNQFPINRIYIYIPADDHLNHFNQALEAINSFEAIEPMSVFIEMKRAVGIALVDSIQSYAIRIQEMYTSEGGFPAALALALQCKNAGMQGLVHGLVQLCLEARDYENLIKAASYETDSASIYDLAFYLFTSPEVNGIATRRERLMLAMHLFTLCGDYTPLAVSTTEESVSSPDFPKEPQGVSTAVSSTLVLCSDAIPAPRYSHAELLKAHLFAELSGNNANSLLIETALAKNSKGEAILNGEALRLIANTNFCLSRPEASRSEPNSSSYIQRAIAAAITSYGLLSSRSYGVSKSDASTQTQEDLLFS